MVVERRADRKYILIIFALSLLLAGAYFIIFHHSRAPLPASITKQVSFKIIYPRQEGSQPELQDSKYDTSNQTLSYKFTQDSLNYTVTEQKEPTNFINQLQSSAKSPVSGTSTLSEISNKVGRAYIVDVSTIQGSPKYLGKTAIVISKGTVMYLNSGSPVTTTDQWTKVINSLLAE